MTSLVLARRLSAFCAPALALIACASTPASAPPARPDSSPRAAPRAAPKAASKPGAKGRLAREVIQQTVRASFPSMQRCYESALARSPNLKGRIVTRFVIDTDGTVSLAEEIHDASEASRTEAMLQGADPKSPRFPDDRVTRCVVAEFAKLRFPPPEGGAVTVVYPIQFSAQ